MMMLMISVVAFLLFGLFLRMRVRSKSVGFLHPASGCGGGGERVLWVAIQQLLASDESGSSSKSVETAVLFTSRFCPRPGASDAECTEHLVAVLVPKQFGITLTEEQRRRLQVHYIPFQWLQDPAIYPIARL